MKRTPVALPLKSTIVASPRPELGSVPGLVPGVVGFGFGFDDAEDAVPVVGFDDEAMEPFNETVC